MGASSRSPSPITMVPRMCSSLKAFRIASTAAWSAPFSSPRPISRAEAIEAASVSRTASSPMFLSILSPLQRLQQPVRRAGRPAVFAHADVHRMPQGDHFVTPRSVHLVLESNLHPGVGGDELDLEQVVVAGRLEVLDRGLVDREHDPALLDVAVGDAQPADPFVARALEEAQVGGVVDHPHLIGIAVDHAIAVRLHHCTLYATSCRRVCSFCMPLLSMVLVTSATMPTLGA